MGRLFLSSLITLGVLFSLVFGMVFAVLIYTDAINFGLAIGLTIFINVILWLIGPWLTDFINRIFYKVTFLTPAEVKKQHPEVAEIISAVTKEYNFAFPKLGIIPDKNPTAFTYGSARFNSRIVLTEGIFEYLNKKETQAVVAHELGHIVHRDFIVMMVASTLVQILYEIYAMLIRARGKKSGSVKILALAAYALYIVGIYLVYYLSRTREYLADEFSAKRTSPLDLSNALIKVAYGIVAEPDDVTNSKRLLESTRHLGIIDVRNAKHYGVTSQISHNDPDVISDVMVFDKVNPWAKLIELNSTHPLTGNRIGHLADLAKKLKQKFPYDIAKAIARAKIDYAKLYLNFILGFAVSVLPYLFALAAFAFFPLEYVPGAIGIALLLQIPYKYPLSEPTKTTVLEEMRNPYASPLRGKPIELAGKVIGRGIPGYVFGEDLMFQDKSGLIFLNYVSAFSFIGDIFFALKKVKALVGVKATAAGWFFRGIGSMMTLKYLETGKEKVRSQPLLWSFVFSLLLIAITVYLVL